MNRLDSELRISASMDQAPVSMSPFQYNQRLVVVILGVEEEALLASRILELNKSRGLPVILTGIVLDAADGARLRRKLVTLVAFLKDGQLTGNNKAWQVEIRMEQGRDWIGKIKSSLHPYDMVACYEEQTIGALRRPLSDILTSSLNVPIYTFAGLRQERATGRQLLSQAISWGGSLASIGGFLMLQARIVVLVQGGMQTVLLLLTLFAEVGLLWFVNCYFTLS